jgi:hypothetical protein
VLQIQDHLSSVIAFREEHCSGWYGGSSRFQNYVVMQIQDHLSSVIASREGYCSGWYCVSLSLRNKGAGADPGSVEWYDRVQGGG